MSWKVLKNTKIRIRLKVSHIFYNHLQRINVTPDTTFDAAPMKRGSLHFPSLVIPSCKSIKNCGKEERIVFTNLVCVKWKGFGMGGCVFKLDWSGHNLGYTWWISVRFIASCRKLYRLFDEYLCVSWRFFVWEKFGLVDPLTRKMKITTTCTQHGNLFPYFYNLDTNYIIFVVP